MATSKTRADYGQLKLIADRFGTAAADAQDMLLSIQQGVHTLQDGDWVGQGANAFYAEMNSDVLPSLKRLIHALRSAQNVAKIISVVVKEAEDAATAILKDDGSDVGTAGGQISPTPTVDAKGEAPIEKIVKLLGFRPAGLDTWTTDQLTNLRSWLDRGVKFSASYGNRWSELGMRAVLDALNMTDHALSGGADIYLGLSNGITFEAGSLTCRGRTPNIDHIILNGDSGDKYAVAHELGRVVDMVLGKMYYGTSGYPVNGEQYAYNEISYSTKTEGWYKRFGWIKSLESPTGWEKTWGGGRTTYYADTGNPAPNEDFAESFAQFIYDRNHVSSGFGRTVDIARREFIARMLWACQVTYDP